MANYPDETSQPDWFDTNAPTAGTQASPSSARGMIIQAYQQYLDRTPEEWEITAHLGKGASVYASIENIKNSPEALAIARKKAAAAAAPAASAKTGNLKDDIQAILRKYPPTQAGLAAALPEIQALYPNARITGSNNQKLDLTAYGAGIPDVIEAASAGGGKSWTWDLGGAAAGATINPNAASYDAATFGQLRQPFSETFAPEAWKGSAPYTGPASTNVAPFSFKEYTPTADFVPPTEADLYQDPSYKVRFAEGQRAVDTSAAAKGNLMTGGTLRALAKYGGEQASKEYANVYNRSANTWGANQAKNLAEYQAAFGDAAAGWGLNTGQANTQFTQARDTWGMNTDLALKDYLTKYDALLKGYQTRYGQFNDQRNFDFNNLYKLATLGASSA